MKYKMKWERLKELEDSFESGSISKEEYEMKKKETEEMPEENVKVEEEEIKEAKLKSDKILIIGVVLIAVVFASLFGYRSLTQEKPETIDELHALNSEGKLKPDQGYIYNEVHSFVKFDDLWYTQLVSPGGSRLYNIQFRFGPNELEDIEIEGSLDLELFNNATNYFATFNPIDSNLTGVALAVSDFNQHMTNIFFKSPIAACDRNETQACNFRPIVTCDSTEEIVLYVREANESRVAFDDNCIVIEGSGLDLVKGVDRVLLNFYDVMEQ